MKGKNFIYFTNDFYENSYLIFMVTLVDRIKTTRKIELGRHIVINPDLVEDIEIKKDEDSILSVRVVTVTNEFFLKGHPAICFMIHQYKYMKENKIYGIDREKMWNLITKKRKNEKKDCK